MCLCFSILPRYAHRIKERTTAESLLRLAATHGVAFLNYHVSGYQPSSPLRSLHLQEASIVQIILTELSTTFGLGPNNQTLRATLITSALQDQIVVPIRRKQSSR
jgi:hypothetical protein